MPFSHRPKRKGENRYIVVNLDGPSNALRYLFHCQIGPAAAKVQTEHCVPKKRLPGALMRSRSAPNLRGFIPRGLLRLKRRWLAGRRRVPELSSKKPLTDWSTSPEVSTSGSALILKPRCYMESWKPRSAQLIRNLPPNQPMERTPPCCALRCRSSARYVSGIAEMRPSDFTNGSKSRSLKRSGSPLSIQNVAIMQSIVFRIVTPRRRRLR